MFQTKETIEQSVLAQQVYLDIVRGRRLMWASETEDPELKRVHIEIAGLLEQTREECYELLSAYHLPGTDCTLSSRDPDPSDEASSNPGDAFHT
jgi:hypothetical protein